MAIDTIESLREHLQWSIEIEHGTLPPYLCALYSIQEGHNVEAAEVIHSVFMEEMPDEDFVLMRSDVVAPPPTHALEGLTAFSWLEVLGEARSNSRPFGRYVVRMIAAGVIAGVGVITRNPILIVGGMALSPDVLPISATCVGIVLRRFTLAVQALATLAFGLALLIAVAIVVGAVVVGANWVPDDYVVGNGGMRTLVTLHYSTIAVALAAGVVAMTSFETRAAAAVGVAISVTTVPAAAFFGIAVGVGQASGAPEALATLGVNVAILLGVGSLTLMIQRRWTAGFWRLTGS